MSPSTGAEAGLDQGRRASDETLLRLARHFACHGHTVGLNDELEAWLRHLDSSAWYYIRGMLICGKCVPFILFGATGVFALAASGGDWRPEDIEYAGRASETIAYNLPGYRGPVRVALVMMGEPSSPRELVTREGSCWMVPSCWLGCWLHDFPEQGFARADIARLRELADPGAVRQQRRSLQPVGFG